MVDGTTTNKSKLVHRCKSTMGDQCKFISSTNRGGPLLKVKKCEDNATATLDMGEPWVCRTNVKFESRQWVAQMEKGSNRQDEGQAG